jgi:hypothetical protein
VADLRTLDETSLAMQTRWLGGTPEEEPQRWAAASPATRADTITVPMLLAYGGRSRSLIHGQHWFTALRQAQIGFGRASHPGSQHVELGSW